MPLSQSTSRIASPVLTGDPTAPTPAASDNDTSVATTAFVKATIDTQHTADNGTYGRKERVSLAEYGAVGDGLTDDTAAITAALAAAAARNCALFIPAGTYLTGPHSMTIWPGFGIIGAGMTATRFVNSSTTGGALFTLTQGSEATASTRNPRFHDFEVSGAAGAGDCIVIEAPTNTMSGPDFQNLYLLPNGTANAVTITGTVDWLTLEHVFGNGGARGLHLATAAKLLSIATLKACTLSGSVAGLHGSGTWNVVNVDACEFAGAYGILTDNTSAGTRIQLNIRGSRSEACSTAQMLLQAITTVKVDGFEINDNAVGLDNEIILGQNVRDADISRIYVRGINPNGAVVQESSSGIRASYSLMESCIVSTKGGTGTAYMRRDSAGALYKPITGGLLRGISKDISVTGWTQNGSSDASWGYYYGYNSTGGVRTHTLPDATLYKGREFAICRETAGANNVTINTTSSQHIVSAAGDATTLDLTAQWQAVVLISDGTRWVVTSKNF